MAERMPRSGSATFNIEHTWPQSHLKKYSRFENTKADMFHLFPTESPINSERGNMPFVDCHDNSQDNPERESAMCDGGFQPPAQHRGKVARAMFYMAVAYNMKIDAAQESVLRSWNNEFPVSQDEINRDEGIAKVQHAHNPFILHPEWAELIKDF
jgi:endonuclease I